MSLFGKLGARRRVRTPTVLQMEAAECGAAALGSILGYHGRFVPLAELRAACGVSRDGSRASRVLAAARRYGLEAEGWRKNAESLRSIEPPFIVFWNFNHFLVVEGFAGDRVFLNDPATGPRSVSWDELDAAYTGVALLFEPGEGFAPGGERPSIVRSLWRRLERTRKALLYLVLVGLALVIPGLVVPVYLRVFVDSVLVHGRAEWVPPLLLAMAVTAFLIGFLTWLRQYFLLRMETRLAVSGAGRFLWHVLRLPIEFFGQRPAGDVASRVALNARLAGLLSGSLATTVLNLLVAVFYAVLMLFYDPVLTAVGVAMALVNLAALRWVARKRVDDNQRLLNEQGKLTGTTMSGLYSIESLKAAGAESDFFARWGGFYANVLNAQQDLAKSSMFLAVVPTLLSAFNTAIILGLGGWRVIEGVLTIGMLVAFQSLMVAFSEPVEGLVGLAGDLQSVEGQVNRLDDVLRHRRDPLFEGEDSFRSVDSPVSGAPAVDGGARLEGRLELAGVTFGYSRLDPPLLDGFDLRLEPGSRVALVGASGSGKSTVAKLVMGLYPPWSGEVLFDGRPRREHPPRTLYHSVAMVDQDIAVFEGSIRDNLTLWDGTVAEEDLIRAARDAEIHDVVNARPGGYDARLAEGGRNLSGGQLQRLEIARALVVNPRILILDEATSALDPLTERAIDDNLRRRGVTCLIVAHRLSTIRDSDEILVMDRGRVVERGTHDELSAAGGLYARLIEG